MNRYLQYQFSQNVSRPELLNLLNRIFNQIGPDINSLLKDETSPELLRHYGLYSHFVPPSAENFSYLDKIVSIVVDYFAEEDGKELILNLYLQRFPRNYRLHFQ